LSLSKPPFNRGKRAVCEKGPICNQPFFQGRFEKPPFFLGSIFLTSQPRSTARQHSILFLHTKHARKTFHHASQIAPLIVEKGPICNRPFFEGRFEKPPFFQGPIFLAIFSFFGK
jgi:hypothetical protein